MGGFALAQPVSRQASMHVLHVSADRFSARPGSELKWLLWELTACVSACQRVQSSSAAADVFSDAFLCANRGSSKACPLERPLKSSVIVQLVVLRLEQAEQSAKLDVMSLAVLPLLVNQ